MPDIFGNTSVYGGSFRANRTQLTFAINGSDTGGVGLLTQNIQGRYRQQVSRIFEISSSNATYFIVGRAEGMFSMGRIVGPFALSSAFITGFSNPCNVAQNAIRLAPVNDANCDVETDSGYGFVNCILTDLGISMEAQAMLITEQSSIMFNSMTK